MWPRCGVVRRVLRQDEPEVPLVDNDQVVKTLPSQRPDEAAGPKNSIRMAVIRADRVPRPDK